MRRSELRVQAARTDASSDAAAHIVLAGTDGVTGSESNKIGAKEAN